MIAIQHDKYFDGDMQGATPSMSIEGGGDFYFKSLSICDPILLIHDRSAVMYLKMSHGYP